VKGKSALSATTRSSPFLLPSLRLTPRRSRPVVVDLPDECSSSVLFASSSPLPPPESISSGEGIRLHYLCSVDEAIRIERGQLRLMKGMTVLLTTPSRTKTGSSRSCRELSFAHDRRLCCDYKRFEIEGIALSCFHRETNRPFGCWRTLSEARSRWKKVSLA